ncbi:MAG TPA: homoserine dehydrogenase [Rhodanobacteraceae bacterium]|nr:homoserine dehydrogenase [Rhodanobacteraceae bacterium]
MELLSPRVGVLQFGTGAVGSALLQQLDAAENADIALIGIANSRRQYAVPEESNVAIARARLDAKGQPRDDSLLLAALDESNCERRAIIDATASPQVAAKHAGWLRAGYDVITANKAATGGPLAGWQGVREAARTARRFYGDSATVGAGLPVLSTLRRLRGAGDRLVALEGVFSGSLSWLFNHYDGARPFHALLAEARAWGYTEPDPRLDLSGADVARKLLILARAAGFALDEIDVEIENLVPPQLRCVDAQTFHAHAHELDEPLAARLCASRNRGTVLRYLARLDACGNASVGLCEVDASHPAARLRGCENLFALVTARYRAQPLVIQGAGAGPEITAQAMLADLLSLHERVFAPLPLAV